LTTLFSETAITPATPIDAPKPRKHGWLPLLTVLFLISYGLMTMLIVEQGSTIESQRALIRELFRDSSELAAVRIKAAQERAAAAAARNPSQAPSTQTPLTQAPSTQAPLTQTPLTQVPSNQAPATQAPSSQAQHGVQRQAQKPFRMPSKPASDLTDDRRALITI
jgi:cytoskeletal protein RodZ